VASISVKKVKTQFFFHRFNFLLIYSDLRTQHQQQNNGDQWVDSDPSKKLTSRTMRVPPPAASGQSTY